MKIERILVPIDFSEASIEGLEAAADLAERTGAVLDVLHVWEEPAALGTAAFAFISSAPDSHLRSAYERTGERLRRSISGTAGRVTLLPDLEVGTPWRTICEVAKARGADLIVMGTHTRRGLAHALSSHVAEKVLRHAACPVLAVPSRREAR
jgi:nucleotide-binding universal stress UspA family protein